MRKLILLGVIAALAACAQADQDQYKCLGNQPVYGETNGVCYDATNDYLSLFVNDTEVAYVDGSGNLVLDAAVTGTNATFTGYVSAATPSTLLESQLFCGQGANGTTASYIGPVNPSIAADMTTYVFGAAGCDGLDSTTEATADAPLSLAGDIKVFGMACTITDGGTDDLYTFTLRDDTATVTGVTCGITLNGAGTDTCTVKLTTPVTVAHGSTMAVMQAAATDDDCSACDTECVVYFTR